ncbi:hypothetical protein [Pseudoduganella violaceinigra]|uniref:hypothetical protein n=1 Tax=Pseudoduganella violaceinigra TaxID=246602 RepID=UPI00041DE5E6|nr:hypothetical protein [Pseudoduganella violaceinigra]
MKRRSVLAVAMAGCGALGIWWLGGHGAGSDAVAPVAAHPPVAVNAAVPAVVVAPAANEKQASEAPDGDGLKRVPLPPVDTRAPAWISMAQARETGDERTPPIERSAPAEHPDAGLLADHDAYAAYELAQKQRLAAAYVQAAAPELSRLQADLERGREAGIPPEELARVAEKIRRIDQQRQAATAMLSK